MLFGLLQERMSWPWQGKPGKKPFIAFWCVTVPCIAPERFPRCPRTDDDLPLPCLSRRLGCIPHMFSWAVVMSYFFNAVAYSSPEDYVWAAIIILFLLDGTFAVNMLLQQYEVSWGVGDGRRGKGWGEGCQGERDSGSATIITPANALIHLCLASRLASSRTTSLASTATLCSH